jgi:hypothetical protein
MVNWEILIPVMRLELKNFVDGNLSGENLYKVAIKKNLGPEVRQLIRPGVSRARRITRAALRRRELV